MFSKLVGKHAARIRSYGEEKMHVLKFFDVRGYLIMAVMMGGGIALRSFHLVPGWFIAFFYTGSRASRSRLPAWASSCTTFIATVYHLPRDREGARGIGGFGLKVIPRVPVSRVGA